MEWPQYHPDPKSAFSYTASPSFIYPRVHQDGLEVVNGPTRVSDHPTSRATASNIFSSFFGPRPNTEKEVFREDGMELDPSKLEYLRPTVYAPLAPQPGPEHSYAESTQAQTLLSESDEKALVPKKEPTKPRICGLTRRTCLLIAAVAATVLIIALAAGIAGGVVASRNSAANSSSSTATNPSTITTASPVSSSTATSTSSTAATSTTFGVTVQCPSADGQPYVSPKNTSKTFQRQCNTNYAGNDLFHTATTTFEQCMDLCAQTSNCVAVNWLYRGDQGTGSNYCWVKKATGQSDTGPLMESAVLLTQQRGKLRQ